MGTVSKALTLLDLFSNSRPEIGLSEIARLAGLNKATAYRMLGELQGHGFVEQIGAGGAYRLGPALLRLASLREAAVPRRKAALVPLQQLSDATGETAHLSLIEGDRLVTLAYSYSSAHGTSVRMEDASETPFHATATGHAALAFTNPETRARILNAPLERYTPDTLTDVAELQSRLDRVRALGYAESVGGFEADVHSLAVPLFDASSCIGAVAVAAPAARVTPHLRDRIIAELGQTATEIVSLWGGFLPEDLQKVWANAG